MPMPRVNIFAFPHKGLKNALSQILLSASKLDMNDASRINAFKQQTLEVLMLLHLHQHSEDTVVFSQIEAQVSEQSQHCADEHIQLRISLGKIEMLLSQIEVNAPMELSVEIFSAIGAFFSDYLKHMAYEENELNQVIWANFSDEQILDWQATIMSSLTPEQSMSWFKYIIPALNPMERMLVLGDIKVNAPAEVLNAILEMLTNHLPDDEHQNLLATLSH